jgi:addiction module RelB/DinJ family antitoxin
MAKTTLLRVRVDVGRKNRAETIFARYGLTPTQAINIFYAKVSEVNGLPFDLRPSETEDLLMDPEFRIYLARLKADEVRYLELDKVPRTNKGDVKAQA